MTQFTGKRNFGIELLETNLGNFRNIFFDETTCLRLLAALKWEDGFTCRNCGHHNSCRGKSEFSRRCTKCKKEESVTSHTIFHKCKIPLNKAFEIAYMACNFPATSSYELSRQSELRHMTCYNFKKKIQNCKEDQEKNGLLTKIIAEVNQRITTTN